MLPIKTLTIIITPASLWIYPPLAVAASREVPYTSDNFVNTLTALVAENSPTTLLIVLTKATSYNLLLDVTTPTRASVLSALTPHIPEAFAPDQFDWQQVGPKQVLAYVIPTRYYQVTTALSQLYPGLDLHLQTTIALAAQYALKHRQSLTVSEPDSVALTLKNQALTSLKQAPANLRPTPFSTILNSWKPRSGQDAQVLDIVPTHRKRSWRVILAVLACGLSVAGLWLARQSLPSSTSSNPSPTPSPSVEVSPPPQPPVLSFGDYRVRVLNATKLKGLAQATADRLTPLGFSVVETGNAQGDYTTNLLYAREALPSHVQAELLRLLGNDLEIKLDKTLEIYADSYDIVIILGQTNP